MNYRKTRVIYYDSDKIKLDDILWGLIGLGIDVERSKIVPRLQDEDAEAVEAISQEIREYDYAFTQNFNINVAAAANIAKVKYISWIYDSPQVTLYTSHALYDFNYVFSFDKKQVERLRELGLKHVYHRPLAANTGYISTLDLSHNNISQYESDVSFIGSLYRLGHISVLNSLQTETRNHILDVAKGIALKWDDDKTIFGALSNESICEILAHMPASDFDTYKMDKRYSVEVLLMAPIVAQMERLNLLNIAAGRFGTTLYTGNEDARAASVIKGLMIKGPVWREEPYKVYRATKLNLNITNRSIETGAPQRIFDIMGAGGMVFSNRQAELEELFVPDKEIVLYGSVEEFIDKSEYYITHEKQRQTIAYNGQMRVNRDYNYITSLKDIFSKVEKD